MRASIWVISILTFFVSGVLSGETESRPTEKKKKTFDASTLKNILKNQDLGELRGSIGPITPQKKRTSPTAQNHGISHQIISVGTGKRRPAKNDIVRIYYKIDLTSVQNKSRIYSHCKDAVVVPVSQLIPSLRWGIQQMTEGETASFKVPASSVFPSKGRRPGWVDHSVTFRVQLLEILEPFNYRAIDVFPQPKRSWSKAAHDSFLTTTSPPSREPIRFLSVLKFWEDGEAITQHYDGAPDYATQTSSGLSYVIHQKGSGARPDLNDHVEVKYFGSKGMFYFDTSMSCDSSSLLPINRLISGLKEGLLSMREGELRELWIPAHLAYGHGPDQLGKPSGPLVFSVELIKVHAQ